MSYCQHRVFDVSLLRSLITRRIDFALMWIERLNAETIRSAKRRCRFAGGRLSSPHRNNPYVQYGNGWLNALPVRTSRHAGARGMSVSTLAAHHRADGPRNDADVEAHGPVVDIRNVVADGLVDRKVVTTAHLPLSGDTRLYE